MCQLLKQVEFKKQKINNKKSFNMKKIRFSILLSCVAIIPLWGILFAQNAVVVYPENHKDVSHSGIYSVKISQGEKVYNPAVFVSYCNIFDAKAPGTMEKDKTPLTEYQGRSIHFSRVSFSGEMTVEITLTDLTKVPMGEIKVLPSRFGIKATKTADNKLKFTISKPGQYSVEVGENGYKNGFLIFADPLETDIPKVDKSWMELKNTSKGSIKTLPGDVNSLYFKAGVHDIGVYKVPSHIKKIYLEGGAYVYGSFIMNSDTCSNVKIYGRGVLSGGRLHLRESHLVESLNGANNITVSGIIVTDFVYFAVRLLGKRNLVDWTKIVGGWIWNCDGIAAWEGSTIKNCFIWANDDNIKIYQDNITVEDVVCWQLSNGAIIQLNWGAMKAAHCKVKNIDIVRAEWHQDRPNNGVLSCRTSGGAQSDFIFENITVEHPVSHIFRLSPQGDTPNPIENFVFKNWNLKMDMSQNKTNYLEGAMPTSPLKGIVFDQVKINGTLLTADNYVEVGRFSVKNCEPITFK
jgi:hypothetical protein